MRGLGCCVSDQDEELGVTLPSGQESWSLQVPYLSEVRKFCRQGNKPREALPLAWATQSAGVRQYPDKKVRLSLLAFQDVDTAYLQKVDLQSKADVLSGEVNFLKYLFEMVSSQGTLLFSHLIRHMSCKTGWPETK